MKQDVNYILHHKNINYKLIELNLNATHISLYNALFLIWNNAGFPNKIYVNRNEVMAISKIGSYNTYLKCLKDLHKHKLIKYKPSHNPLKGSEINLYRFDITTEQVVYKFCTSSDISSGTSSGTSSDISSDISSGATTGSSSGLTIGSSIEYLYKHINYKTIKPLNHETLKKFKKIIDLGLKFFEEEKPPEKKFTKKEFKETLLQLGADEIHVNDWLEVRTKKKAAFTQTALKSFANECNKHNFSIADAVKACAENSWAGFKYQWVQNLKNNQNGNQNNNSQPTINRQTAETIIQNGQGWEID